MPNKSPGEGTLFQRQDGRWQASIQVNGVRKTVYARSEREARQKLRTLQKQADTGLPNPGKRTLDDLLDAWLESAHNLKPSTRAKYASFLDAYVRPALGDVRLSKLTPDRIQRFYAALPTPSVAERIHRLLHRAFAVAVLWRWLAENPCDRVVKPEYRTERKPVWSQDELQRFFEGATDHWLHPLWALAIVTGCRLGELLALHWTDVGFGGVAITINKTLHRIGDEWVFDAPKTASAVRTIILPAEGIKALECQHAQQEAWQEVAGAEWETWGSVFTGETGKPLFHSTVQHALKRECRRLDLPPVTPHGLRHLHASLLLSEGVPVTAVSARLGHANPGITMRVYAHALKGQDSIAAKAIDRVLVQSGY
ncbi:MAG: site-specific integrase [Anaerolineae bacterium]|nr:site-specific integrase [Anaerolineae bacterium]